MIELERIPLEGYHFGGDNHLIQEFIKTLVTTTPLILTPEPPKQYKDTTQSGLKWCLYRQHTLRAVREMALYFEGPIWWTGYGQMARDTRIALGEVK